MPSASSKFSEVKNRQGWSDQTMEILARNFIEEKGLADEFVEFLEKVALSEDTEICDECGANIPNEGVSLVNNHHEETCSLYDHTQG